VNQHLAPIYLIRPDPTRAEDLPTIAAPAFVFVKPTQVARKLATLQR
jgi:hypothetical protein